MGSRFRLREPFSGISHLIGAALSIAAMIALIIQSHGNDWKITSFAIYGGSLILLYLASSLYHLLPARPEIVEKLRRFDQCAIFFLIAGCYTPVCLLKLRGPWGWTLLSIVWAIALGGTITQAVWAKMPCWLNVVLYIIMGWMVVIAFGPITHHLAVQSLEWLLCGGIIYSVGAVVFAVERPRLWPGVFGFHDLWHVFVLAGSAAHFMMMLTLVRSPV
ncbi:MAG TPA: hemolysin III family protein [Armatimonadota bacterium]|nr:hemolysin III family protein [Armatimonadota bacterium]